MRRILCFALLSVGCLLASGCLIGGPKSPTTQPSVPNRVQAVSFGDPFKPIASNAPIILRGARNETIQVTLQLNELPDAVGKKRSGLQLHELKCGEAAIPIRACQAYQVLPMPVDAKRASFVRHTGAAAEGQGFPRALLPLAMQEGLIPLKSLRNADRATDPKSRVDEPGTPAPIIWIDIQIPPTAPPGEYQASYEILEAGKPRATVPIKVTVDDFVISDERHLMMVGLVDWESLVRLYPKQFAGLMPHLLSRRDARYAGAVKTLDEIVKLAQGHRCQVIMPQLRPIVKWPSGKPVQIDWADFDSIVAPWLTGDAFADLVPLGYWPLPTIDHPEQLDAASRTEYWSAAAAHFDQFEWLTRSAVPLEKSTAERVRLAESMELSEEAARILAIHSKLRVAVPLEEDQIQLASQTSPKRIPIESLDRILYAAPGLVSAAPMQRLPEGAGTRWLRTDLPGVIPYAGAGADEREVRLWAWLAYLRRAQLIQWPSVFPSQSDPAQAGNPEELVWFYPGSWFGVSEPVPTVQLKWLRRAQQDYEYLWLARQRGQAGRAMTLARVIAKPVEIPPTQTPDAVYGLMSGSSEAQTWAEAMDLLTRTILLSQPGQSVDPAAEKQLTYQMTSWSKTHERPLLLGRSTEWTRAESASRVVELKLGLDVYNAAEQQPERNRLHWASMPEGWQVNAPPVEAPQLKTYSVNRFHINTQIHLDKLSAASRQPVKVTFTDGFTGRPYTMPLVVPVAYTEQRQDAPPQIDGSLGDWAPEDALHEGPLVQMLSRPMVEHQELRMAQLPSAIYSTWTPGWMYFGFRVEGAEALPANAESNFVSYQGNRAWGEDACEMLIQPVYADNSVGPLVHLAMKPRGQLEISRRLDPKLHATPWQAFAGAGVRYKASMKEATWRGELMIPWDVINDPQHMGKRPAFLRFNFAQHRGDVGESASWAGPVDFGRDEAFMGLLEVREGGAKSEARNPNQ